MCWTNRIRTCSTAPWSQEGRRVTMISTLATQRGYAFSQNNRSMCTQPRLQKPNLYRASKQRPDLTRITQHPHNSLLSTHIRAAIQPHLLVWRRSNNLIIIRVWLMCHHNSRATTKLLHRHHLTNNRRIYIFTWLIAALLQISDSINRYVKWCFQVNSLVRGFESFYPLSDLQCEPNLVRQKCSRGSKFRRRCSG